MAKPGDTVLLGDVDEIPSANMVRLLLMGEQLPVRFLMDAFYFCLDWYAGTDIPATVITTVGAITTPAEMRHADMPVVHAGWHLSYMGGPAAIDRKLGSFSHAEMDTPNLRNQAMLAGAIAAGRVPWNGVQLEPADLSRLPRCVAQNLDRFAHMLRGNI